MKQPKAHQQVRKLRKGKRRKGILWEYNEDGMSATERVKGFWKTYWKRWERRRLELKDAS